MSSMAAREQILGRLRAAAPAAAQARSDARDALDHRIDQHCEYLRGGPMPAAVLVQRMQAGLGASRADVLCATVDAWPWPDREDHLAALAGGGRDGRSGHGIQPVRRLR